MIVWKPKLPRCRLNWSLSCTVNAPSMRPAMNSVVAMVVRSDMGPRIASAPPCIAHDLMVANGAFLSKGHHPLAAVLLFVHLADGVVARARGLESRSNYAGYSLYARRTNDVKSKCRLAPGADALPWLVPKQPGRSERATRRWPPCAKAPVARSQLLHRGHLFYILSRGESYPSSAGAASTTPWHAACSGGPFVDLRMAGRRF
jgi:hypothetical protein